MGLVLLHAMASLVACSTAAKSPSGSTKTRASSWRCPDTGLHWFTYADPDSSDSAWHPPAWPWPNSGGLPRILPGLHLNYSYSVPGGDRQAGRIELIQPHIQWIDDLNRDGLADMAIQDLNGQHYRTLALLNCGNDRYLPVFDQMAEDIAFEEDPLNGRGWKLLRAEWIPSQSEYQENWMFRWDGSKYTKVCEYRLSVDSLSAPHPSRCP